VLANIWFNVGVYWGANYSSAGFCDIRLTGDDGYWPCGGRA